MVLSDWLDSPLTYPFGTSTFPEEPPIFTWPGEELECKVEMSDASPEAKLAIPQSIFQVSGVVASRQPRRSERHHAYTDGEIRAILTCTNEVWIKRKRDTRVITTPQGIPFLHRQEVLTDPRQSDYQELLVGTLNMEYAGSFQKEMVDIWIWYRYLHFTMTLADAISGDKVLTQIEFEYDGHLAGQQPPSLERVLAVFDELTEGNPLVSPLNTTIQTKFDWLVL